MPYVVDGNNVMAQPPGSGRDLPRARTRLIHDLVVFVSAHRVKVKVVFDGHPDEQFPEGCVFKGVRILYARQGADADGRIKELVRNSSHKRDIIMVSSDKALVSFAARQGARTLASHKFRQMLSESQECGSPGEPGSSPQVDVDDWLEFFANHGDSLSS
jgi:predicted RNA-binding protein with PIN domain